MSMHAAKVLLLLFLAADSVKVPTDPGLYYLNPQGVTRLEGRAVTVAHSTSKLPPIPLKGALPLGNSKVKAEVLGARSEEHTSELQSLAYLVCRLLLEKKKKTQHT